MDVRFRTKKDKSCVQIRHLDPGDSFIFGEAGEDGKLQDGDIFIRLGSTDYDWNPKLKLCKGIPRIMVARPSNGELLAVTRTTLVVKVRSELIVKI